MQQGLKSLKEKADHQGYSLNKAKKRIHKTNFNLMLQTKPSILIVIETILCTHFWAGSLKKELLGWLTPLECQIPINNKHSILLDC